jgi:hypothetical protein
MENSQDDRECSYPVSRSPQHTESHASIGGTPTPIEDRGPLPVILEDQRRRYTDGTTPPEPRSSVNDFSSPLVHENTGYAQQKVVLENSNMAKLASNPYLLVHSLTQEDHDDTDDASAGEIYAVFVPESSVCGMQSSRRRPQSPSVMARNAQTHRTAALYGMWPSMLCTRGDLVGPA